MFLYMEAYAMSYLMAKIQFERSFLIFFIVSGAQNIQTQAIYCIIMQSIIIWNLFTAMLLSSYVYSLLYVF